MKKKVLALFSILLTVAIFATLLSGCSEAPSTNTPTSSPTSPIVQIQADITAIEANIATNKSKLSGLETAINNINVPAGLASQVDSLAIEINKLQADIADIENNIGGTATQDSISNIQDRLNSLETITGNTVSEVDINMASIADLQLELDTLQAEVDAIEPAGEPDEVDLTALEADIDTLQSKIDGILLDLYPIDKQATLDSIDDDLTYIDNMLRNLDERIDNIDVAISGLNKVTITNFETGSLFLEFTTQKAGDYIVVLTLFDNDLSGLTINETLLNSWGIDLVSSEIYGATQTMAVVILQPSPNTSTTPTTFPTWAMGKLVQVQFGISIDYAMIETGVR